MDAGSGLFLGGIFFCLTGSGVRTSFFGCSIFSAIFLLPFSFGLAPAAAASFPESLPLTRGDDGFLPFLLGTDRLGELPLPDDSGRCNDFEDGRGGGDGDGEERWCEELEAFDLGRDLSLASSLS